MRIWFNTLSTSSKAIIWVISSAVLVAATVTIAVSASTTNNLQASKANTPSESVTASKTPTSKPKASDSSPVSSESPSASAEAPQAPQAPEVPEAPADSAPVASVPGVPTSIYNFSGSSAPGNAFRGFRFQPPVSDGGSPITAYTGSCSLDGGATWTFTALGSSAAGDRSMTCSQAGLDGSIEPIFQIRAENAVGPGAWALIQ